MNKRIASIWTRFRAIRLDFHVAKIIAAGIVLLAILPLALWIAAIAISENYDVFSDKDQDRGARVVETKQDLFGDAVKKIVYLDSNGKPGDPSDQNWTPSDSLWFYNTPQGSDLLPYDLFIELEKPGSKELFRSDENIDSYRYLPQKATSSNPDALPVGFAKDRYKGVDYVGFTCAACHTAQVNFRGTGLRIDGGPAMADMPGFLFGLSEALKTTANLDANGACINDACREFVQRVLAHGHYKNAADVTAALKTYRDRIAFYIAINRGGTAYGFARLDAFGRIYNRALEFVANGDQLKSLLRKLFTGADLEKAEAALDEVLKASSTDHLVQRLYEHLDNAQREIFLYAFGNAPNAPVSYPFLWDVPQHDYVQWNGLAPNAGLGPVGRNTGEVVGVFATLEWQKQEGFSIASFFEGQGLRTHVSFVSSVNVHNLRRIEQRLAKLESPRWPTSIFGAICKDPRPQVCEEQHQRGEQLFSRYCAACHTEIDRDDPNRRVIANMTRLASVGTDPMMARNSVTDVGGSGMLRNLYASTPTAGNVLLNKDASVAAILAKVTLGTVADPYPYRNPYQRVANWIYDLLYALSTNGIKASMKVGSYDPDTSADPYASVKSYKARSLNGIWAAAPYLHNGSVPTLYDLLLPKRLEHDPSNEEYRPTTFLVGSREFDPDKVGFGTSGYTGFTFDTRLPGNCNAGHEYGTIHKNHASSCGDAPAVGSDLPPLTKEQRMDLLEYLKSL